MPYKEETQELVRNLQNKYGVTTMAANCEQLRKEDVTRILSNILYEFPVSEIQFFVPKWVEMLPNDHELKLKLLEQIREQMKKLLHIKNITRESVQLTAPFVQDVLLEEVSLSSGKVRIRIQIRDEYYYRMLSEMSGIQMETEYDLIHTMKELAAMKEQYVKVQAALESVRESGYGVVVPELGEIQIEEPSVIRQGSKYGVRIKSKSPSIHMIKANIETEIAPIVGTEQQAKDLIPVYRRKRTARRKHLGNEYIWKIHRTAGAGRHPKQTDFHWRREPVQTAGHHAENRQRQQRRHGVYYYIKTRKVRNRHGVPDLLCFLA